jgi:hypothetical protein
MEVRPQGGTRAPLMLDWAIRDSAPNTNAECVKPDSCKTLSTGISIAVRCIQKQKELQPVVINNFREGKKLNATTEKIYIPQYRVPSCAVGISANKKKLLKC